jgi:hypothetical protein
VWPKSGAGFPRRGFSRRRRKIALQLGVHLGAADGRQGSCRRPSEREMAEGSSVPLSGGNELQCALRLLFDVGQAGRRQQVDKANGAGTARASVD